MKLRLFNLLEHVRSSLWFIPSCMSVFAALLAVVAVRLDSWVAASSDTSLKPFLYNGDLDGARTLLGTIASSMVTVAGVTFSVTIVALSLASSQFGPRLISNFMRDRGNQMVLGTFIATFLFCVLALGHGRGAAEEVVVPAVSSTVAVLLAVASLVVLIYFIHHVAESIRAEHVVDAVARDLDVAVERLLTKRDGEKEDGEDQGEELEDDAGGAIVEATADGYLQAIDGEGLLEVAKSEGLVVRVLPRAGHFVVEGDRLVIVVDAGEIDEKLARRIRQCFIIGRRRTGEQDPEYGIHQLVEVALRALSPGINDPYTAISCVDWLGAVLCKVGRRELRAPRWCGDDGKLWVQGDPITFAGMLDAAFDQIRQNAQAHPSVSIRLLEVLGTIAEQVEDPTRRRAIRRQADMSFAAAMAQDPMEKDREDLESRYRAIRPTLEAG